MWFGSGVRLPGLRPTGLRLVSLLAFAALLAGSGAAAAAPRGSGMATIRASRSPVTGTARRWPMSLCRQQPGHRFGTTTVGDTDQYVGEPASKHRQPTISAHTALRNFHKVYGPTTAVQDRHMQVRFGLISVLTQGALSDNAIGYVPWVRRTGAWLFTNCRDPSSPANGYAGHHVGGQMWVVIADTVKPKFLSITWLPAHPKGMNRGLDEIGGRRQYPPPGSTRFYSTPWTVAARGSGGKLLLQYQPRRCYTLDHVYAEAIGNRYHVSVILSSGPHGGCPRPSATAPYTELLPYLDTPIKSLLHLRTGHVTFEPENA